MADRIISAEVRIDGKDNTGGAFSAVAKKIDQLGKAAKVSPQIDSMAKSLTAAQKQLAAFDRLLSAKGGLGSARTKFNEAKLGVEQAARAMKAAEAPSRQLTQSYERAQRAVSQASAALERQKSIWKEASAAVAQFGTPLNKVVAEQSRLRGAIDQTTSAIAKQTAAERQQHAVRLEADRRAHEISRHGFARFAVGAAAGAVGVHGIVRTGEAAWEAGAERQQVLTGMGLAGMSPSEVARAQRLAAQVSRVAPNMSVSQILELHKEARSAVQHPEEVFELMPDLAKASSVLKGMGAEGNIADLVKAGESLGMMGDPARFHRFLEGQIKAQQVLGKTISTEQIYEAAKYTKASGSTLSDDFINLVMPSLIQELHGSSAGDAISAVNKRLRGGLTHQHMAVQRLQQMGLLEDPSQIRRSKTGEIIGYSGKVKGDDVLQSDQEQWFQTFFKGGAAKLHMTSQGDINKLLSEIFPSVAANVGRIYIQQQETIAQHRRNNLGATGLDESISRQRADWNASIGSMKSALDDLGAELTKPSMKAASLGISHLADVVRDLSDAAARHPIRATGVAGLATAGALYGAGRISYSLMAAGPSLQTAGTMLQEAAISLGASPRSRIPGILGGSLSAGASSGSAIGGGLGMLAGLGTAGTIAGLAWLIEASAKAQKPGHGGMWAPATFATRALDEDDLADMQQRLQSKKDWLVDRASKNKLASFGFSSFDAEGDAVAKEIAELQNQIRLKQASLRHIPQFPIRDVGGDYPTMGDVGLDRNRRGQSIYNIPLSGGAIGGSFPTLAGLPQGPIDVTGKVQAETDVKLTANFNFSGLPDGASITKTNQTVVSRPSNGPTMKHAVLGQGGVGHM